MLMENASANPLRREEAEEERGGELAPSSWMREKASHRIEPKATRLATWKTLYMRDWALCPAF